MSIKIKSNIIGHGSMEVDGTVLKCVGAVKVQIRPRHATKVFVELIGEVEIETEADVVTKVIHPEVGDDVTSLDDTVRKYATDREVHVPLKDGQTIQVDLSKPCKLDLKDFQVDFSKSGALQAAKEITKQLAQTWEQQHILRGDPKK